MNQRLFQVFTLPPAEQKETHVRQETTDKRRLHDTHDTLSSQRELGERHQENVEPTTLTSVTRHRAETEASLSQSESLWVQAEQARLGDTWRWNQDGRMSMGLWRENPGAIMTYNANLPESAKSLCGRNRQRTEKEGRVST